MPMRSGREFIEGLRAAPREVWIAGRRIDDVTADPVFKRPVQAIASLYDLQVSPEHRVFWERGRFFYTVRNALYSMYKFEIPRSRRVLGGIAFLVKGIRNGVFLHALRAIMASRSLSSEFRNTAGEAAAYKQSVVDVIASFATLQSSAELVRTSGAIAV